MGKAGGRGPSWVSLGDLDRGPERLIPATPDWPPGFPEFPRTPSKAQVVKPLIAERDRQTVHPWFQCHTPMLGGGCRPGSVVEIRLDPIHICVVGNLQPTFCVGIDE